MKDQDTFVVELRIAATGETYSAEISPETTVQQIIDAFMGIHSLEPNLGLGWKLMHKAQVLANNTTISELIDMNSPTTLELIAKVQGG